MSTLNESTIEKLEAIAQNLDAMANNLKLLASVREPPLEHQEEDGLQIMRTIRDIAGHG